MRSEEKLNELFKTLREENVTTSVSDVSSWINVHSTSANIKKVKKTAITKKIIIMSAIITPAIIGSIILFSGKQHTKPDNMNSPVIKQNNYSLPIDSSKNKDIETAQKNIKVKNKQFIGITTLNYLMRDSTQRVEEKNTTEAKLNSNIHLNETDPQSKLPKVSKNWRTFNDSLNVDTLFNGVKSLVFTGDEGDITVRGSKRSNLTMNYHYRLKTKGVYVKKAKAVLSKQEEANCGLSYELVDSVLTIHLEIKSQTFSGIGLLSETSKLEFNVPENIAISINTSYGDVELNNLSSSNYRIKTLSGDVKMESVNGNVTLSSISGDVSLKNAELNNLGNNSYRIQTTSGNIKMERVNGNITLSSSSGDVSLKNSVANINVSLISGRFNGNNINVVDAFYIGCTSGNVDCEITNPDSELRFNLYTASGKIKVQRQDLSYKGFGGYTFGQGNLKITAESTSGNIIIR
ncbi:MAG: DUF4097 family beta strand repeat protein [Bacteroidetes bacterium]|nr:DUF4097 family beta strand repeat protein [Bacteroidota bacterium]MCA6442200.1 DUF4097 family beta strand repeat protein [Bacteroidota bacterium]